MSTVNNMYTYAAATSTWDTIKGSVVDAANWVGRQGKWAVQSVSDFMVRIYEFAKPFFVGVAKFFANSVQAIREFFIENKHCSLGVIIGIGVGAIALTLIQYLCFNNQPNNNPPQQVAVRA